MRSERFRKRAPPCVVVFAEGFGNMRMRRLPKPDKQKAALKRLLVGTYAYLPLDHAFFARLGFECKVGVQNVHKGIQGAFVPYRLHLSISRSSCGLGCPMAC
jgi:hypothetical protein